MMTGNMAEKGQ